VSARPGLSSWWTGSGERTFDAMATVTSDERKALAQRVAVALPVAVVDGHLLAAARDSSRWTFLRSPRAKSFEAGRASESEAIFEFDGLPRDDEHLDVRDVISYATRHAAGEHNLIELIWWPRKYAEPRSTGSSRARCPRPPTRSRTVSR
jgi:hypothetical protein